MDQLWTKFKEVIPEAAVEQIPRVKMKTKQRWMTKDILDLMEKMRQLKIKEYKNTKHCKRKSEKKYEEIKEKLNGLITSADTTNYSADLRSN